MLFLKVLIEKKPLFKYQLHLSKNHVKFATMKGKIKGLKELREWKAQELEALDKPLRFWGSQELCVNMWLNLQINDQIVAWFRGYWEFES